MLELHLNIYVAQPYIQQISIFQEKVLWKTVLQYLISFFPLTEQIPKIRYKR